MDSKEDFDNKLRERFRREEALATDKGNWEQMLQSLDAAEVPVQLPEVTKHPRKIRAVYKWTALLLLLIYPAFLLIKINTNETANTSPVTGTSAPVLRQQNQSPLKAAEHLTQEGQSAPLSMKSSHAEAGLFKENGQHINDKSQITKHTKSIGVHASVKSTNQQIQKATPTIQSRAEKNALANQSASVKEGIRGLERSMAFDDDNASSNNKKENDIVAAVNGANEDNHTVNADSVGASITLKNEVTAVKDSTAMNATAVVVNDSNASKLPEKSLIQKPHHSWGLLLSSGLMYVNGQSGMQVGLEVTHQYKKGHFFIAQNIGVEQNLNERLVTSLTRERYFLKRESRVYNLEVRSSLFMRGSFTVGYAQSNWQCYAGPVVGYMLNSDAVLEEYSSDSEQAMSRQYKKGYKNGLNEFTYGALFGAEYVLGRFKLGSRVHFYKNYHAISGNNGFNDWHGYICYTLK